MNKVRYSRLYVFFFFTIGFFTLEAQDVNEASQQSQKLNQDSSFVVNYETKKKHFGGLGFGLLNFRGTSISPSVGFMITGKWSPKTERKKRIITPNFEFGIGYVNFKDKSKTPVNKVFLQRLNLLVSVTILRIRERALMLTSGISICFGDYKRGYVGVPLDFSVDLTSKSKVYARYVNTNNFNDSNNMFEIGIIIK